MDVVIEECVVCKVEATEDDKMDIEKVKNLSDIEAEEPQRQLSPKTCSGPGSSNDIMIRSLKSKKICKDQQNKKLWKCKQCSFKSHFLAGYKRHIKSHDKNAKATTSKESLCCVFCKKCFKDAYTDHTCERANVSVYGVFKCHLCKYRSRRCATSINHLATVHDLNSKGEPLPMGVFWCQHCHFTCTEEPTLDSHMKERHPDRLSGIKTIHTCPICHFNSAYKFVMVRHKRVHQPDDKYYMKHETSYTPKKPRYTKMPRYTCPTCQYNTAYKQVLGRHKCVPKLADATSKAKTSRRPPKNPMDRHTCEICGYYNKVAIEVDRHRSLHGKVKAYKCPFCTNRFTYKYTMGIHVERYHKKNRIIAYSMMKAPCANQSELDITKEVTTSGRVATVCTLLKTSEKISEKTSENSSEKTSEKSSEKTSEKSSEKTSEKSSEKTCKRTSGNPLHGIKLEEGITYGCSLCLFTFSVRSEVKFHCEIAHADKLPMSYKCGYCYVGTKFFSQMVRHLHKHRVHKSDESKSEVDSNIKQQQPFSCDHCDLKFSYSKELKNHKRSKHGISRSLFKCPKCDYTSLDRSDVVRHLKEPHDCK